jgi:hypothetical protein
MKREIKRYKRNSANKKYPRTIVLLNNVREILRDKVSFYIVFLFLTDHDRQ